MTTTQGGHANKTGSVLENLVVGTITTHGFLVVSYKDYMKNPVKFGEELLLRNVPYTTLYGTKGRTEFLLKSTKFSLNIRIECKWQQGAGSVDEKLPYLYLSSIEAMPENEIILLVDGEGFRPGAKGWIRNIAKQRKYIPDDKPNKRITVMNSTEFLTWANSTFK